MLNNGRGYLREGDSGNDKTSIPPKEIESLIDAFYDIPDIMKFKGTKEDDRQSKKHYLLMVYDDVRKMDFVDFVIPREYVNTNNELKLWIETMELTQQNKAANKSQ